MENAFVERHLYSQILEDGLKDGAIERQLGQLEAAAEPILAKFIQAAKDGVLPGLTPDERTIWDLFFVVQWRRVPDLRQAIATDDEVRAALAAIRHDLKVRFPERIRDIDALAEAETEKVIMHNARAQAVSGISERVLGALASRGIALLRCAAGKSFIIGSRPVVQLSFGGHRTLADEPTEMWLPISSDLAVGVGRKDMAEMIYDLHPHGAVRHLNLAIARQSTAFASRSARLTASIAIAR